MNKHFCVYCEFNYFCDYFRNDIHKRFLQDCLGNDPDVLFVGDSILESLQFTEMWNQLFGPLHCLNFSLRGDLVQNVLWRLKNGELEHVKPKVCCLMLIHLFKS